MARGKKSASQQRTVKLKRSRFLEAVREAARIREQAKTYTGRHGAFVKDFTESTNYSKEAFAVIARRQGLEGPRRHGWRRGRRPRR
jgi:hypothetical protein